MAKRGLGKGLDSIFGTSVKKPEHAMTYKTVADTLRENALKKANAANENQRPASSDQGMNPSAAESSSRGFTTVSETVLYAGAEPAAPVLTESALSAVQDEEFTHGSGGEVTDFAENGRAAAEGNNEQNAAGAPVAEALRNGSYHEDGTKLLKISMIQPNLGQPRKNFDETELQELADSIREYGIIQPLIVKKQGPLYEIIAGERRWRAARIAGLKEVPVIVRDIDERTGREIAIIENIQRSDLNAVEEALAYQSLITEYGLTQEEVADKVAKKRSTVTNSLRILKLEPDLLDMLREGKITQGHARALLSIEDSSLRRKIAEKCAKENLSVREIETLVKLDKLAREKKEKKNSVEGEEMKRLKTIYKDLERQMKSSLGTKVSIVPKNKDRGLLEIEYYSQDDLDRIFLILKSGK